MTAPRITDQDIALEVLARLSEASTDGRLRDAIAQVRSALHDELEAALPLLTPQPVVDREALIATLHKAGAYCGDCNYEDWDLCEDCLKVLGSYADDVLALLNGDL